jgi:recombination protein RecA
MSNTSKDEESKGKAIEAALSQIEKQFGKGAVMKMGQKEAADDVPAIPLNTQWTRNMLPVSG